MKGSDLVLAAREYVGCPYRHQGRTRSGLDCLGLMLAVTSRFGLIPLEAGRRNYGRSPLDELIEGLPQFCDETSGNEPGAILAIKWPGERRAAHVAICAGATMIHSYSNAGRVVEHGLRGRWAKWVVSRWWVRGVARG